MKRIIVDYSKLNNEILNQIVEKYPDGYDYDDIISFKNAKNETVEALEIRTEETFYLVKVGVRLIEAMENHIEDDEDEDDADYEDDEDKNLDIAEIVDDEDLNDE